MNSQLRELPVVYKGKSYSLSIRYRKTSKNLIVFLHGWGGTKESFADAFSSAALTGYSICAMDFLGFGKSEKPRDFSYDLLDQAKIVAEAVNSFKAEKVYLVGHSMGGGIGLLAVPFIKNLAMFIGADNNLAPNGSGYDARLASKQPLWVFQYFAPSVLALTSRLHPNRDVRTWSKWSREASQLGLYRSIRSLADWSDSGELLPRFEALPRKAYIYSENGKRKKDVVPKLDETITYEIPCSGHALMLDNPSDFYGTIARIIREA
ncbi:MAG TPA: alpha/beta fold hydrolase [Candidatus Saccharimonadales bacterium]|nr:alpha/beta fold hydrolase [Candidatus Saccharimonadales bacterium]